MMFQKISVVSLMCIFVCAGGAFGAGRSMVGNAQPASRAVVLPSSHMVSSVKKPNIAASNKATVDNNQVVDDDSQPENVDDREQERLACLSNNIGLGNTFVWAAKNSNTLNYASMVEDDGNPQNNTCFVLVGMRSDDARISTADIQPRYFEWGQNITCGSWIDESKMEERILDAKKKARTWGTIGGVVGGAGIGVGAMELFGNRALSNIDGLKGLQGQKQYTEYSLEWYTAKAKALRAENMSAYNSFEELVKELKAACNGTNKDRKCYEAKYGNLVNLDFNDIEG